MRRKSLALSSLLATALLAGTALVAPALAQETPQLSEVYSLVKQLQARVSSLENENKQAKRETAEARAEARDLRRKLGAPAPAASTAAIPAAAVAPGVSASYAMATKAPPMRAPVPSWGGFYAGAAFGLASMRHRNDAVSATTELDTETFGTTVFLLDDRSTFRGQESGRGYGAIANLYLGYNAVLGNNMVVGGQVEGGIANIRVKMNGSGTNAITDRQVMTPPGTASITTETINETFNDTIDSRWLVSALARGGVLIDPLDYIYAIGGWTYARVEFAGDSVGLNGGTIGAGWERILAPGWTLRAEGRYTKFQSKTVSSGFSETATQVAGGTVETGTLTSQTTNQFSSDMWTVWLGITHYFN